MFITDDYDQRLFEIIVEKYSQYRDSSKYGEKYKFEIIDNLNNQLDINEISQDNILEITEILKKENPQHGSFVHWSNLDDLNTFANEKPELVSNLMRNLFDESNKLSESIDKFRKVGKEFDPNISLGTPLFSYILTAFDKEKYTLYKDGPFKDFINLFELEKHSSLGDKYEIYLDVCKNINNKLNNIEIIENLELMHSQDLIYSISAVPELKFDILLKFIYEIANDIHKYKDNTKKFINVISNLEDKYLIKIRNKYEDSEKINQMRYRILEKLIKKEDLGTNEINNIKDNVAKEYEKDILHSWNDFNILFHVFYYKIKDRVNYILGEIYKILLSNIETKVSSDEIGKEGAVKGFDWNQNFGSDRCWIAICPKFKNSHKNCGQLYLTISAGIIEYGLNPGSEISNLDIQDLDKVENPDNLSLEKLITKYEDIYDDYLRVNEDDTIDDLADPFTSFFKNWKEADWAFEFLKDICQKLDVENKNDKRINISYYNKRIHFSFTNWLIVGFYTYIDEVVVPLFKDPGEEFGKIDGEFANTEQGPQVALFHIDIDKMKDTSSDVYQLFMDTLEHIKEIKKNYSSSPYRFSNIDKMCEAIFNRKSRVELLEAGLETIKQYYWVTFSLKDIKLNKLNKKETFDFDFADSNLSLEDNPQIMNNIDSIDKGDMIVGYHSNKNMNGIWAILEVHENLAEGKMRLKVQKSLESPLRKEYIMNELGDELDLHEKTIFEISEDIFQSVVKLIEEKIFIKKVDFNIELKISDLYFPEEVKRDLINRITSNLKNGKHIILTGPPGTGKSKLAKEIVNQYVEENFKMVTACSDWSTYDTIGGYRPERNGELNFDSGVFLECFKNNNRADNKWLIIDEINRADIDKAFGSLFSALTGDAVSLSFKNKNNKNIKIIPQDGGIIHNEDNLYTIPDDWRIIATMNTYDKTSLYEMSYAFMRRFAFIPVSIPSKIDKQLVEEYLRCWNIKNHEYIVDVSELWNSINKVRKIGPAIVEDIYRYLLDNEGDYSSVIISYVLPQFEGVRKDTINSFIVDLKTLDCMNNRDVKRVENFADDYFRLGV
ncbi:MAG: AAA family ATPase [bacterium]